MTIYFKDLVCLRKPLTTLEPVYQDDLGNIRLYIMVDSKQQVLEAFALEAESHFSTGLEDYWQEPSLQVNVLFEAFGAFDGVRHLTFASSDSGYLNYPELFEVAKMLLKVEEAQKEITTQSSEYI
jgi:hypothetical protein